MKIFLGIDPGLDGCLVAIDDQGQVIEWHDTPTITVEKISTLRGGRQKIRRRREYDMHAMHRILAGFRGRADYIVAALEKSQPMPGFGRHGKPGGGAAGESTEPQAGHGSIASFLLGVGWATWRSLLVANGIPLATEPAAVSWKAKLLADRGKDKGAARAVAMAMFPAFAAHLVRVKDHGRAEASLLAEFGRRATGGDTARPVTDEFIARQVELAKAAPPPPKDFEA